VADGATRRTTLARRGGSYLISPVTSRDGPGADDHG
jgi:hypothetical protein